MTKNNMKLPEIWAEHERLRESYGKAVARRRVADSNCTTIINEINDVQKKIDAVVAEEKELCPADSDWARDARRRKAEGRGVAQAERLKQLGPNQGTRPMPEKLAGVISVTGGQGMAGETGEQAVKEDLP